MSTTNNIVNNNYIPEITSDTINCNTLNANNITGTVVIGGLSPSQAVVTDGSLQLVSKPYSTISTGSTLVERTSNGDIEGRFIRAGSSAGGGLSIRATSGQAATMFYSGASSFNITIPNAGGVKQHQHYHS